jgi:hypothetical protein
MEDDVYDWYSGTPLGRALYHNKDQLVRYLLTVPDVDVNFPNKVRTLTQLVI